ncbi:hypothetical protein LAJLEIBI_02936 [[Clostridium] hylemonae DSM 15053]|nr:hypothetical protein LAJLEIBI_02936 [[Clostridium] hylemonae DSM 15053]
MITTKTPFRMSFLEEVLIFRSFIWNMAEQCFLRVLINIVM